MTKKLRAAWSSYWQALDPDNSAQGFAVEQIEAAIYQDMLGLSQRDQAEYLDELTAELLCARADEDAEEMTHDTMQTGAGPEVNLTNEAYREWQGDR